MMRTSLVLAATVAITVATSALALNVGDKAPPLAAETWLNGEAVDPGTADGKTLHVIEFWATWCKPCQRTIPHLNALHNRYKDRVVIVGVSDEPLAKVRPFAERMDMQYRIAIDTSRAFTNTYMAGVRGIPYAVLVDAEGVVVWQGHPLQDLDKAIDAVLSGKPVPEAADEPSPEEEKLQALLMTGDMPAALQQVDKLIQDKPDNFTYYQIKMGLLAQSEQSDRIKPMYREMLEQFTDSADELSMLAWTAVSAPLPLCDIDVGWQAANRAAELTRRQDASVLDTLARVTYARGDLAGAIRLQEEALAKAGDADEKDSLEGPLGFYRSVLQLNQKIEASTAVTAP